MDFLDLCMGKFSQTCSATYYLTLPYPTPVEMDCNARGVPFDYEYVDTKTRTYKQLIGNLTEKEGVATAIKTKEQLQWKIGSFVALMDGKMYSIISVTEDRSNAGIESARLLPIPLGSEYILRLVEYENPRMLP